MKQAGGQSKARIAAHGPRQCFSVSIIFCVFAAGMRDFIFPNDLNYILA
jgi:hypothetical protein